MTFSIVGAGAGSGKTHHIQTMLSRWIASDEVRPERVLAVTFTEAAAGELAQRLRGALLRGGQSEAAIALGRAYVSTIHGLGRRIVTEHALACGVSPVARLIDEAEAEMLLRRAIAEAEELHAVTRDLAGFGYRTKRQGEEWLSASDAFRADLRTVLDRLQGLGAHGGGTHLAEEAAEALVAEWGAVGDAEALEAPLRRAVAAIMERWPEGVDTVGMNETARATFRQDHATLRALHAGGVASDWAAWERARELRLSKRGTPTPEGYDDMARAVMAAAEGLVRHPGPRDLAWRHLEALIRGAQAVLSRYADEKRRLGVIDFADMIAAAERALADEDVLAAVLDGIDCVVVDEFQDTNPVQFALLARLVGAAPRVLLVGDAKQAVMAFQGADARLSQALRQRRPDAVSTLDRNWRSVPEVMAFANALGAGLFKGYDALSPTREAAPGPALTALVVPKGRSARSPNARPQHHVAAHLAAVLADEAEVVDRMTGEPRAVRPADVAILCRTRTQIEAYAEALRALRVPVQVEEGGWHDGPAVAAARAALAFAADPGDAHAGLRLATLGPARRPLEEALRALRDGRLAALPELAVLTAASDDLHALTVPAVVTRVLALAGIEEWAAGLPDPAAHLADLARLRAEASAFADSNAATRAAAGLHGWDTRAFLAWLAAKVAAGEDGRPDPSSVTARGVELVTWHAAKGREWPVVVVVGLDWKVEERAGTMRVEFEGWDEPATLLERARLRRVPEVACAEVQARLLEPRLEAARATERCLAYVAVTRARDRLVLEWPAWLKDRDGALAGLLAEEAGLGIGAGALHMGGSSHEAQIVECPETMPVAFDREAEDEVPPPYPCFGRLARPAEPGASLVHRPSQGTAAAPIRGKARSVGPAPGGDAFDDATARGTALHLAMRVWLTRPDRADALEAATGLPAKTVEALRAQAEGLRCVLATEGFTDLQAEVPVEQLRADGTTTRGTIDLVALDPVGGRAAVIDFKSPAPADPVAATADHAGQLAAYVEALEKGLSIDVERVGVHWIGAGTLAWGGRGPDDTSELLPDSERPQHDSG